MEIKTKFNIGDVAYFMYNDKIIHRKITSIYIVINDNESSISYVLQGHLKTESNLFSSKDELIKSL